ncbi:Thioredoxin-like [Tenacibaculum sp. MAR_2009_124]|uniref:VPGUxxT family thioredoxin-like (seleno)protein, type 2 n=1 Tax=Tenacibaculum sp. MAR_2009_124 TaxID=1250059 RepID=UPI00089BC66A|nr:VPGUxxT family thioredoxin-like (seleno)protein, type 2 [Tenacibaculum sp. MAR_2009_124]SEC94643.1 Thioredoxin-like [Tenacibaculum sp. MAR_2009_124]
MKTNPNTQNIELGKVSWHRDYNLALNEAKKLNKPIFILFQEVPGCRTCVNFGIDALSHPLMVELIESKFVPLAIFNNIKGKDREVLEYYGEATWNNPVVRIVNTNGKDIVEKLSNNYNPLSLYNKMEMVLLQLGSQILPFMKIVEDELILNYGNIGEVIYETPCFWSGETSLIQYNGVLTTEAGWVGYKEVVKVQFNKELTSLEKLNEYALDQGFYLIDSVENYRIDKTPQYYISKSNYKYLPLSPVQRARINKAIPYKDNPSQYLSSKQLDIYKNISNTNKLGEDIYKQPLEKSWNHIKF